MNPASEVPSPEAPGAAWFSDDPESNAGLEWWKSHVAHTPDSKARRQFQTLGQALAEPQRLDATDWSGLVQRAGEAVLTAIANDTPDDPEQRELLSQSAYSAINNALASSGVQIKLGYAFAGQRFDPETMEAVESKSASRFVVQQVHTWPIRDTSTRPHKLVARAKVTTA